MDVAAKVVVFAQHTRNLDDLLHRVVGALDDAAGKEKTFDAISAIEIEGQRHNFIHRKARALHIARHAIDAVQTVVRAKVGEQNFE